MTRLKVLSVVTSTNIISSNIIKNITNVIIRPSFNISPQLFFSDRNFVYEKDLLSRLDHVNSPIQEINLRVAADGVCCRLCFLQRDKGVGAITQANHHIYNP